MSGLDVFLDARFAPSYERHPLVLVDVGARGGLKSNWLPARRHLRVLGFEPDKAEFDRLVERARTDGTATFFNTALHNSRATLPLYVARDRGLTSIFEPDRAFLDTFPQADRFDTVSVVEMQTDTLDNVLGAHGITDVDFIKADTQGSELYVLEGAARALASAVLGVEVEVEFAPLYKGQPLFADVDAYLRSHGFFLFDLRPCYWKRAAGCAVGGPRGQMIWADALYLRGMPAFRTSIASLEANRGRAKLLKAISVAILYGYFDYALEITAAAGQLLTADERAVVGRLLSLERSGYSPLPNFFGRRRLAAAAHRLWQIFVQRDTDAWSVSNSRLGNSR